VIAEVIDFPSSFSQKQLDYIAESVVETAQQVCRETLRDVILYGSYARGDYQEWSDVDIMILADADDAECKQFDKLISDILYDLAHHMNLLLSVIVTPFGRFERMMPDYPFYLNVSKEGKRLCSTITG